MKQLVTAITALALLLAAGCTSLTSARQPAPGGGVTLEIAIDGIDVAEGLVQVALFDSPEGFPGEGGGVVRLAEVPAEGDAVQVTFTDLAPGRYAVSVYHDRDGNGLLETDRFGRPRERYGTSNNVRGGFGPPTFAAAAFTLDGPLEIGITLVRLGED